MRCSLYLSLAEALSGTAEASSISAAAASNAPLPPPASKRNITAKTELVQVYRASDSYGAHAASTSKRQKWARTPFRPSRRNSLEDKLADDEPGCIIDLGIAFMRVTLEPRLTGFDSLRSPTRQQ